jgi:O-phospho-L-seryl-tRNASec:L-selenocysteinyl-tRNA synthase
MNHASTDALSKTLQQSFSIPKNHISIGITNLLSQNKDLLTLLSHRRLPNAPLSDLTIQSLLLTLSNLDTNPPTPLASNRSTECGKWVGVGEREGRVYAPLVSQRHWGLAHGMGRSGDLAEAQPKALGSTILVQLTKDLVLDALRRGCKLNDSGSHLYPKSGIASHGMVVPMCTGMSMALVLSTLKQAQIQTQVQSQAQPKQRNLVLWSRIDQKSCLKAVSSAGLECMVIPTKREGDEVTTDLQALESILEQHADQVLAVISTTSAFAPRVADRIDEVAKLLSAHNEAHHANNGTNGTDEGVAHVINNAYGLQCERTNKLINRACTLGRVDVMISSTDKNFLVPVGGAILTSPSSALMQAIGKHYAGRASSSPLVDLCITLLSMGLSGYQQLLAERKALIPKFQKGFQEIAERHGERLLTCPRNTISFGITLDQLRKSNNDGDGDGNGNDNDNESSSQNAKLTSLFGSMLFTRCVSGTRVVPQGQSKTICGHEFVGFGSSTDDFPHSYLTAACAIGLTECELEEFFKRLERCFKDFEKRRKREQKKKTVCQEKDGMIKTDEGIEH